MFVCLFVVFLFLSTLNLTARVTLIPVRVFHLNSVISYIVIRRSNSGALLHVLKNSNQLPFAPKVFATSKAITPIQQNEDNKK